MYKQVLARAWEDWTPGTLPIRMRLLSHHGKCSAATQKVQPRIMTQPLHSWASTQKNWKPVDIHAHSSTILTTKGWKQHESPSTVNKTVVHPSMEDRVTVRMGALAQATTWTSLQSTMPREKNTTQNFIISWMKYSEQTNPQQCSLVLVEGKGLIA